MEEKHDHVKLVGPIFLIGIGCILLLNNMGFLNWNAWDIVRLWPILLIATGLEVLIGRRSLAGSIIAAVLVLLLMAGGVWLIGFSPNAAGDTLTISEPLDDFSEAAITIAPGVGRVTVDALEDSTDFVTGEVGVRRREALEPQMLVEDGFAHFKLESEQTWIAPFTPGSDQARTWALSFHPNVTLDLHTEIGAGELYLNLGELDIDTLSVEFGMGQAEITLPESDGLDATISGAIGDIIINVPVGAAVRIEMDTGLVDHQVPSNYARDNDAYESPNYRESENPMHIEVNLAIGQVTVRESRGE